MLLHLLAAAGDHLHFKDLGLDPVAVNLGFFQIKWYSLAYIAGILVGWWYLLKLLAQPGSPMSRRHADDLVFYATLGIILGGRIGYVLFYAPEMIVETPLQVLRLWDGGMSFHGGVIGTTLAIILLARRHGLNWLRIHDYVACFAPFGLFFGRLANFVNGELWGKPTDVPWAIVFRNTVQTGLLEPARHPSQLYEAGLEGIVLFVILWFFFWRTDSRYQPGKLVGIFVLGYGLCRFFVEFFREPDAQLGVAGRRDGPAHGPVAVHADDRRRHLSDRHRQSPPRARRADRGVGERGVILSPSEMDMTNSEPLLPERLARAITMAGPIPLSQFMGAANAHYYATRDPLGARGDFTTAPEISQMFGELIGLWLADLWDRAGRPAARYVELGPGRGTLAADALRAMAKAGLEPPVDFVETSPTCAPHRPSACRAPNGSRPRPGFPRRAPLLVVANEFFDALPIRQLVATEDGLARAAGRVPGHLVPADRRRSQLRQDHPARPARRRSGIDPRDLARRRRGAARTRRAADSRRAARR